MITPALADRIDFDGKKMFGGLAFMVNTHMSCGMIGADLTVRVGPDLRTLEDQVSSESAPLDDRRWRRPVAAGGVTLNCMPHAGRNLNHPDGSGYPA